MKNKNKKKFVNYDKNIITANIGDACTGYMRIFGANNNLMRHLPSLVDGLKPGERRILYNIYEMGIMHNSRYKKVETLVGNTLKYHPHGSTPVYETLVKLAQPWNNIQCLVDGFGNFGSAMGDSAAAGRYIEARMSFYSYKCFFEEFSPEIVDMKPNYDESEMEPEYLPARYPNALINNTFGIGYGISTGIPTYNFKEVVELTIKLLEDPDYSDITLIPDSPSCAYIIDEGQFTEISETGKGKFKMRGVIDIDEVNNSLIIKSAPLQVSVNDMKETIIDSIPGIKEIRDNTDNLAYEKNPDHFFELEIILKKEIDPVATMHALYTKTNLEKTFPVNFKLITDYEDRDYNIRSLLLEWLDFRRETKRRLYNYKLTKAKTRQHLLEIMLFILNKDNAEKTVKIMKESENKKEAAKKLIDTYGISSLQADAIADMRMSSFYKEAYRKYVEEKKEIDKKVEKYEKIVRSSKKIDAIIKEELEEGIKLFGIDRRSKVITTTGEKKIRDTNHTIVFTLNGFVKKLPDTVTSIGFINQNDYPINIMKARNTTDLLIFDETGKISKLPVHMLPNSELNSEGERLNKYCTINGSIRTIIPKPTEDVLNQLKLPVYFLMITKKGIIKKTLAQHYVNIKNELLGMIVKENDSLRTVMLLAGDKDIVIYTNKGFGMRMSSTEIKETSRLSIGVKAIELEEDEEVIGMDIVNEKDKFLFVLTNKGTGKKSPLSTFPILDRNSKPLRIVSLEDDENVMIIKTVKGNETFKAYLKNSIEEIKLDEVVELPRLSKGRKLIPVRKGEVIIDIEEIKQ